MIISTAIQNIPAEVWIDSFAAVNLHPHHHLCFSDWIKNIARAVKTVETAYFWNHEVSYYDAIPSVYKNMTVIKRREVMYDIHRFTVETSHGKSPWTKQDILSLIRFSPLDQIPKIKYAILL